MQNPCKLRIWVKIFGLPLVFSALFTFAIHAQTGTSESSDYHDLSKGLHNSWIQFEHNRHGRIAFLGGSITYNGGWRDSLMAYFQKRFPETKFEFVAAGIPSGPPTGAITKLMAANSGKFTILDVTSAEAKKMDGGRLLWTPYVIKAGTYPGQDKDINTIAQPNFLGVNASVDENHVYLLTKTMYENLPFLQAIHPATKVMAVEKAMAGLPVPLHPGAAKYYKEMGMTIPSHLVSK